MAKKLSIIILFLFFTLSLAHTPSTQPENDVTHLKLPSENDVIRTEHHVPSTLVRFRPINRRFSLRSNLPFRLCRHHQYPVVKHQIPYGNNDMILSAKKNNIDFDKFVYRIGVQQIPSDRFNFHHQRHHYDEHKEKKIWKFLEDREMLRKMKLKDQSLHYHHHHDNEEEEDDDREQKREDRGGELNQAFSLNQFRAHHVDDDEADKRSKLYAKHYGEDHYSFDRMKLRKRFHYNNGEAEEEKAKEENKWHNKEKKKDGFMRSVRKFLHNYFD